MWCPGPEADIKPGNALPMASIPTGTFIHNIELYPGKARSWRVRLALWHS